ncbi:MAG: M23 family metallopeptidase [Acidobacteria bacterium]|nr:M23 family metallopeptidase [Acidobacteriota bacterium]
MKSGCGWLRLVALLAASGVLLPGPSLAGESGPCGEGLELRLSSRQPAQGSLVVVEVVGASPLSALRAEASGQALHFWQDANPENRYRALLGVDLERQPGGLPLAVEAELAGGARPGCRALVSVQDGRFALERLELPRRFVELSARDLERAEREAQRLRELFARVSPERLWAGGFRLPVEDREAAGNFGRRRVLNNQPRSPHSGEDFPGPAGTPVVAAQRGRVVLAEELFFSGNTVVLDHGLGLYTFYGHLESIAVEPGRVVEAGTLLGRLGATGRVSGPHLHWAARLNRARVNPRDLVALLPD